MSSHIVEVCKIDSITPHPNADKLDIAAIKGWHCIVGRSEYKAGDMVIFVPPDSVIPDSLIEERKLDYLKKGNRIRAVKLRGFVSQGLVLSLPLNEKMREGEDVGNKLGIVKYEPPQRHMQGVSKTGRKRSNPWFFKYTDIENIRHYNTVFKDGEDVIITEKIHGSNWRAAHLPRPKRNLWDWLLSKFFGEYEFVYGSHNVQLDDFKARRSFYKNNPYGKIMEMYQIARILPKDYTIYGEIYGKGIQDLTYGKEEVDLVVFDIRFKDAYLSDKVMRQFCKERGLPTVPLLWVGQFSPDIISQHTSGKSKICQTQIREGCVVRPFEESNDPRIGRKILKSISEDYLLRKEGTEYK